MGLGVSRARNKLTAIAIKAKGIAKLQDGGGLILDKQESAGKWLWRYSIAGRRRDMGLGAWPETSLADARKARDRWAAVQGVDPISERDRQLAAQRAEIEKRDPTLKEVADETFAMKKAELRGEGERGRWFSPSPSTSCRSLASVASSPEAKRVTKRHARAKMPVSGSIGMVLTCEDMRQGPVARPL